MHFWDKITDFAKENQNLAKIGVGDILGTGIASFFWFYIAASMGPENYGEIQYFLGIAGIAQIFSLFGTSFLPKFRTSFLYRSLQNCFLSSFYSFLLYRT